MEIKGKYNTAICFAKVVEEGAIAQIQRMCDYEFTEGSKIRIMPDVHAGKGCTIGTTMTVIDKAVPNIVGVDIGCGMYTINIGKEEPDYKLVDEVAHYIPSGHDVWKRIKVPFEFEEFRCFKRLSDVPRLRRSLGTLGGGNHFIEIDKASDGTYYLVIHSGSRNLGKQVAEIYQWLAINLNKGLENHKAEVEAIIAQYKAEGREKEIQSKLDEISLKNKKTTIPEDLCYLYGPYLEDYLHDIELCQKFARINRETMASIILEKTGMTGTDAFHTIHNYIDTNEMILRKGAISAYKGEKVLIPINMRDGSIIAIGRGNPEWNYSAPHGAGRVMSRSQAVKSLSLEDYQKSMEGIYTTSVSKKTLDEAPMVYKSLEDIIDVIRDSVDVVEVMKPVYNFKAPE